MRWNDSQRQIEAPQPLLRARYGFCLSFSAPGKYTLFPRCDALIHYQDGKNADSPWLQNVDKLILKSVDKLQDVVLSLYHKISRSLDASRCLAYHT